MKRLLILSLFFCFSVGLPSFSMAKNQKVRLAHISSTNSVTHIMSMKFKEEVEKALPGFEVEVYPSGQLGGTVALMQGLQMNMVQIYPEFPFIWEGIVPEFKVWGVHYKFKNSQESEAFANSDLHEQLNEKLVNKANVRLIGHVDAGTFTFLSNKPIRTISDVRGIKNRVAQMAPLMECWRSYGAHPTPLDWGEVYTSLATGVIEGIDNPMPDMYAEKFYEVTKYLNFTNNLYNVFSFNTSEAFWKTLNPMEKKAFQKAIESANETGKQWSKEQWGPIAEQMKEKGVEFIHTDLTGFTEAVQSNIETILGSDKNAIKVYRKIMDRDYSRVE